MAVELATAYIALVPSLKGASQKISQELGAVDTASAGSEMGRKMGGGMVSSMKSLVAPAIGLLATGAFAGFIKDAASASDATDKFKATMAFAGMDTSAITKAKDAAKEYADQTVYDLPTIQNMTAQLASNGVKDYTGLTKAAGNLNAVAGGNADTFKSVAMVMTQTAGAGKLTTENWNQMADAIPGAAGPLMKSLKEAGAYTGNFRDAMAAGQISSDEFNASLMKLGNDPVAVEAAKSTKTFEGAIGSLQATINSGLMDALDAMKPAITGAISGLSNGLGAIFKGFGAIVTLFKTGDFNGGIRKALGLQEDSPIIGAILNIRGAVKGFFDGFTKGVDAVGSNQSAFAHWGAAVYGVIDGVRSAVKDFVSGFTKGVDAIGSSQSRFAQWGAVAYGAVDKVHGAISGFVSGFAKGVDEVGSNQSVFAQWGAALYGAFAAVGPLFKSVVSAIAPLIPQFLALWGALSPVQLIFKSIQPLLPELLGMFGQLAMVIGGTLSKALAALLPAFVQLQGVFVHVFQQVLAIVLPVVVKLITMLGQTLAQLIPVVVPIITQIATLAGTLIAQLAPILVQLISSVMPMVVTVFGAVLQAIGPVIQMITGLLIPIIQALMPVVVTVFGVIADVITAAMQIVMGIIQVVTGIITGNWSMVWEGIKNIFAGVWNTIVALVSGVFSILGSIIGSGLRWISGTIGNILGSIGQFFANTWNGVVNGVSGMIGQVGGFFSGLWGTVTGALSGAGTWLYNAGRNIIDGLISGVRSMMGAIGNAILSLVPGPIVGVFKAALGINSPSRVFRGFGKNIVEGLILGTGDKTDELGSTMRDLVTVPSVPSFGSPSASIAGRSGRNGGATFNTTINQVDDPIGTAHAVQRRLTSLTV